MLSTCRPATHLIQELHVPNEDDSDSESEDGEGHSSHRSETRRKITTLTPYHNLADLFKKKDEVVKDWHEQAHRLQEVRNVPKDAKGHYDLKVCAATLYPSS